MDYNAFIHFKKGKLVKMADWVKKFR